MKTKNPVILIIRDGWGYSKKTEGNYIKAANTPNEDYFLKKYSNNLLKTSGLAVGLEPGYQGNSEVGHLTIGAGRIIYQALTRINQAIKDKSFFKNKAFLEVIHHCQKNKTNLHLVGLLQTEGVHAHLDHLYALLRLCQQKKFSRVFIHIITDGRDALPTSSLKQVRVLKRKIKEFGVGEIVSVSGRYYAMDRDNRWSRTKQAFESISSGKGLKFTNLEAEIQNCHQFGETDEFIKPRSKQGYSGLKKQDGLIFFNFRTDRTRQLTKALIEPKFSEFKRLYIPLKMTMMTEYYKTKQALTAFPNISLKNLLGETVSQAGLKQLRISETEKYAHVTFFFNGQIEKPNQGEDRILINSPKVATYDLKPEMSVFEIASRLTKEIEKKKYELIIVNLVNGDMVGHTANKQAIIKAVEAVDKAQGVIIKKALEKKYTCLVLADHGNAEDKSAKTMTSHTTNPVPIILISSDEKLQTVKIRSGAGLVDVAPTILKIMGLKIPKEMTGRSIIVY